MKILFGGFIAVLILALAIQFVPKKVEPRFPPTKALSLLVPAQVEGWVIRDEPLGDTELLKQKVETILKYDDYVFRLYRRGDLEIGLYVAYWKPGASDIIEVGSHSPDLCWPQNGWTRKGDELEERFIVGGRTSEIAQVRTFTKNGLQQHTVFWHLMGGKRTGYAQGDQSRWSTRTPAVFHNLVNTKFGFSQAEQYFIRITSNRPLAEIRREPLFDELLKSVAQFGIFSGSSE